MIEPGGDVLKLNRYLIMSLQIYKVAEFNS